MHGAEPIGRAAPTDRLARRDVGGVGPGDAERADARDRGDAALPLAREARDALLAGGDARVPELPQRRAGLGRKPEGVRRPVLKPPRRGRGGRSTEESNPERTQSMESQVAPVPAMRFPERWLAVLRIVVGLWFLKALFTKLTVTLLWGFLPVPTASERWTHVMPMLVAKYAEGNPVGFFRAFLQEVVISHAPLFAQLTAFGEVAVGLGLTLGFLTSLAAGIGLVLVVNYGLAVQWQGSSQQGLHYLLIACMVVFLATRAGRRWGLDGWVRVRHPESPFARLPLG
jgi:thiosulfate dehydrogenase (quinone) large subunit